MTFSTSNFVAGVIVGVILGIILGVLFFADDANAAAALVAGWGPNG